MKANSGSTSQIGLIFNLNFGVQLNYNACSPMNWIEESEENLSMK